MRHVVLGLAVLLVLSGCTTPFEGGPRESTSTESVTPAPVPISDGPPGVDPERNTVDTVALVAAHERAFENATVSMRLDARRQALFNVSERERRGRPLTIDANRSRVEVAVVTSEPTRFYSYTNDSAGFTYGTWSNGSVSVDYASLPSGVSRNVSLSPATPERSFDPTKASALGIWFNNSQVQSVERVETAAGVRYRITATSDDRGLLGADAEITTNGVANGTLIATVRPDGLVTDLRLGYTLLTHVGNFRTTYRLSISPDVTTLPRPFWVQQALAEDAQSGQP